MRTKFSVPIQRSLHAEKEKKFLDSAHRIIPSHLTLEEIVAIAAAQNLDLKVKALELEIQKEATTGAVLDMLPELLFNGEAYKRNNNPGSSSESLEPGVPPAPPSVSSEKIGSRWDLNLTWNLLDFGISYYKARQEASGILVKNFEYERQKQKIILDIAYNFWNAAAAIEAIKKTNVFLDTLGSQEISLIHAADNRYIPHTRVLLVQDKIIENQIKLNEFQKHYHNAMTQLKQLMGLPPGVEFEIVYDSARPSEQKLPHVTYLEELALLQRPELYTTDAEENIAINQVRISYLQLFPGSSVYAAYNYDSNRFLIHNHWKMIGLRTVYDLLSIPSGIADYKVSKKQVALAKSTRIALALATISQVNLAYLTYLDDNDRYLLCVKFEDNKQNQLRDAEMKMRLGRFDLADLLELGNDSLESEIRAWKAYAEAQYALEQLNNAIGMPLHFKNLKILDEYNIPSEEYEIVQENFTEIYKNEGGSYES
jgi:outer membrane protein TolC